MLAELLRGSTGCSDLHGLQVATACLLMLKQLFQFCCLILHDMQDKQVHPPPEHWPVWLQSCLENHIICEMQEATMLLSK